MTRPITLLKIKDHQCRWIIGEVKGPATKMCGKATEVTSPYCKEHEAKAWQRRDR